MLLEEQGEMLQEIGWTNTDSSYFENAEHMARTLSGLCLTTDVSDSTTPTGCMRVECVSVF